MGFSTVKSCPYGQKKHTRSRVLWSETYWRFRVLTALLELEPPVRWEIATLSSFRFNAKELEVKRVWTCLGKAIWCDEDV